MKKNHYVNNKDFYEKMKEFIIDNKQELQEEIAITIWKICENLANKSNFCGYSYKDDMIMFAFEQCYKNVRKFDPNKSNNPFAYFTQIAYNAFIKFINDEKKQQAIKMYYAKTMIPDEEFYEEEQNSRNSNRMTSGLRKYYLADIIDDYLGIYNIEKENLDGECVFFNEDDLEKEGVDE